MSESFVQVTEGSGKKLRTKQRVVGPNTVEEEAVFLAEAPMPTYVASAASVGVNGAGIHAFQLMAGASLNLYVRRLVVYQQSFAAAAGLVLGLSRLTTAGTGGTAISVPGLDTTDPGAGATAMTGVGTPGTVGSTLWQAAYPLLGAIGVNAPLVIDFDRSRGKALRVPAGAANGIVLRTLISGSTNLLTISVEFAEAAW